MLYNTIIKSKVAVLICTTISSIKPALWWLNCLSRRIWNPVPFWWSAVLPAKWWGAYRQKFLHRSYLGRFRRDLPYSTRERYPSGWSVLWASESRTDCRARSCRKTGIWDRKCDATGLSVKVLLFLDMSINHFRAYIDTELLQINQRIQYPQRDTFVDYMITRYRKRKCNEKSPQVLLNLGWQSAFGKGCSSIKVIRIDRGSR